MMSHSKRKLYYNLWLPLIASGLLIALTIFWLIFPYNSLQYGEYYVDKEMYKAGEMVKVTISEFCTDGSSNSVERWLDNEVGGVALPPLRFNGASEPLCINNIEAMVRIPEETVPGQYRFEFNTRYQPNPIRTVKVTTYTPYFEVIK